MRIILLVLNLLLMLTAANNAHACSWLSQNSVCEASASAEAIFIGSVYKLEPLKAKKDDFQGNKLVGQLVHVRVEDVFKGKIGPEIAIHSASCDLPYQVGERWVFYASYDEDSKTWSTGGVCGRSRQIKYAANDLLYLRKLPASAEQTRISGVIEYLKSDPEKGTISTAISGVKLKIIGKKRTAEVYTDQNGIYEIYGLPPGEYMIKLEALPERIKGDLTDAGAEVELMEKGCAELNFSFHLDAGTSIAGKVRSAEGNPLPNVLLGLQPKGKRALQPWQFVYTNNQGDYRLENIPPGDYLIVVNGNGDISSYAPFSKAYYPGVLKEANADIVHVAHGDRLEGININISTEATTYTIQGLLLYADKSPVEKGSVRFKADSVEEGTSGEIRTQTDAQGRFSLIIRQGLDGRLSGFINPDRDVAPDCHLLQNPVTGSASILETEPLRLKITSDLQDIKLLFSFAPCEKPRQK
jgi:carboxypeptidase family protein